MKDCITYEDILAAVKEMEKVASTPKPMAVFHPDCVFDDFDGMTLGEAEEAGLLPDYVDIKLSRHLPGKHGYLIPDPSVFDINFTIQPLPLQFNYKSRYGNHAKTII